MAHEPHEPCRPRAGERAHGHARPEVEAAPPGSQLRAGRHLGRRQEQANGKPFTLYGFDWDYGGSTESWNGGALANLPGGCAFAPIFEPDYTTSDEIQNAVSGDTQFASDSQAMRAAKVRIRSLHLRYPRK